MILSIRVSYSDVIIQGLQSVANYKILRKTDTMLKRTNFRGQKAQMSFSLFLSLPNRGSHRENKTHRRSDKSFSF